MEAQCSRVGAFFKSSLTRRCFVLVVPDQGEDGGKLCPKSQKVAVAMKLGIPRLPIGLFTQLCQGCWRHQQYLTALQQSESVPAGLQCDTTWQSLQTVWSSHGSCPLLSDSNNSNSFSMPLPQLSTSDHQPIPPPVLTFTHVEEQEALLDLLRQRHILFRAVDSLVLPTHGDTRNPHHDSSMSFTTHLIVSPEGTVASRKLTALRRWTERQREVTNKSSDHFCIAVSVSWVYAAVQVGRWVDPSPFELALFKREVNDDTLTVSEEKSTAPLRPHDETRKRQRSLSPLKEPHNLSEQSLPPKPLDPTPNTIRLLLSSDIHAPDEEVLARHRCHMVQTADDCTHYVVRYPAKTENFMCCMARGAWIVTPAYLDDLLKQCSSGEGQEYWKLDELHYEWRPEMWPPPPSPTDPSSAEAHSGDSMLHHRSAPSTSITTFLQGVSACRLARQPHSSPPFARWQAHLCCSTSSRTQSFSHVLSCGGCLTVMIHSSLHSLLEMLQTNNDDDDGSNGAGDRTVKEVPISTEEDVRRVAVVDEGFLFSPLRKAISSTNAVMLLSIRCLPHFLCDPHHQPSARCGIPYC